MSLLEATCTDDKFKGWPLAAAIAIENGEMTPREAKDRMIAVYEQRKAAAIAEIDAAIAATQELPDEVH